MKIKYLTIIFSFFSLLALTDSCHKVVEPDDKNKIDIKGTLMNGDMKNPNIEATYEEKTLCVKFYDDLGECIVSVSNKLDSVIFCDTVQTYPYLTTRFYMGDLPLSRYHLIISNSTDEAEGWFFNFRLASVRPKQ